MPKLLSLWKQKSPSRRPLRGLMDRVVWRPLAALKEFPGNPRCHPESQIVALMKSIRRFWTNPILVDETGTILAGQFSRDCRALMESRFYKRVFSTRINPRKSTETEFETTRRGSRLATSIGATVTGRGADIFIIDDPTKSRRSLCGRARGG